MVSMATPAVCPELPEGRRCASHQTSLGAWRIVGVLTGTEAVCGTP